MIRTHIDTQDKALECIHFIFITTSYIITLYVSIVYINDLWTVGDVWNYHNIPKSKQKIGGFLSNLFRKLDRNSQVEISILSQQLTESQQARKETERSLQEVIESHLQEIHQSNTRHQKTQSWLDETDSQLKETQVQLQASDTRLQETQSQLEETQSQLQETQVQLQHAQQNIQDCRQVFVSDNLICTHATFIIGHNTFISANLHSIMIVIMPLKSKQQSTYYKFH